MKFLALTIGVATLGCAQIAGLGEHRAAEDGGIIGNDGAVPGTDVGGAPDGNVTSAPDADSPGPGLMAGVWCTPDAGPPCPSGLGDCAGTGCNVRLTSDPDNCGACGRSCQGGECRDGECRPVTVIDGQKFRNRRHLAVTAAGVHWATADGWVYTWPFTTANAPTTLAQGEGIAQYLVADDEFVYLITNAGPCTNGAWCLRRISLEPGKYPATTLADVERYAGGMAVDASAVYWFDGGGAIKRLPTRVSGLIKPTELATGQRGVRDVSVDIGLDAEWLYWATAGTTESVIKRVRIDGSVKTPERIATARGVSAVAIDATNVYWTDFGARAIQFAPKNGGPPFTLAVITEPDGPPVTIAVDDVNVYWGSQGGYSGFWKVPKCGGAYRHAAGGDSVFGIVPWGGRVYWNDGTSRLSRIAP